MNRAIFDRTDKRYLEFREFTEASFASVIEEALRDGDSLEVALDAAASMVQAASWTALPQFCNGYLPATHRCDIDEFRRRFGTASRHRQHTMQSFSGLYSLAKKASTLRLLVGGSFIDEVDHPKDIDVVLLIDRENLHIGSGRELFAKFKDSSFQQSGIDLKIEADEVAWWGWYRLLGKLRGPRPGYRGLVEVLI